MAAVAQEQPPAPVTVAKAAYELAVAAEEYAAGALYDAQDEHDEARLELRDARDELQRAQASVKDATEELASAREDEDDEAVESWNKELDLHLKDVDKATAAVVRAKKRAAETRERVKVANKAHRDAKRATVKADEAVDAAEEEEA